MKSSGRVAALVLVALLAGFVGGVWFMGSGLGFELIPAPRVATAIAPSAPPKRPVPSRPRVKAVAVPAAPRSHAFGSGGLGPRAERLDLLPTPGCQWEIEPRPFRSESSWQASNLERAFGGDATIDPNTGGLRLLLIQSTAPGVGPIEVRPVFFDENANRLLFETRPLGSSVNGRGTFVMRTYRVDPNLALPPSRIRFFGLERVASDAARRASEAAQADASARGLKILPPPRLGQTYSFDLATADGKSTRTEDFKGKLVVVVVWGPYPTGKLGLFFLKSGLKDARPDEVAVVGVSFDGSLDDARETLATIGRSSPLVVIPNDASTRRVWTEGAEISQVPTYYLLDRDGKLRFVCDNLTLRDSLDLLRGRPKAPKPAPPARSIPQPPSPPARQKP